MKDVQRIMLNQIISLAEDGLNCLGESAEDRTLLSETIGDIREKIDELTKAYQKDI